MDGQREVRKSEPTDKWRKEKKDKHLKLLAMTHTILFYKNYKK